MVRHVEQVLSHAHGKAQLNVVEVKGFKEASIVILILVQRLNVPIKIKISHQIRLVRQITEHPIQYAIQYANVLIVNKI